MVEKWRERSTYGKLLYNKILRLERRFQKENNKDNPKKKEADKPLESPNIDTLNALAAKIGYLVQIALQNLSAIEEKEEIEELRRLQNNVESQAAAKERTAKTEPNPTYLRG